MSAFPDLAPIAYFPVPDPSALRAVGWLARGHDFRQGAVSHEFFERLCRLMVSPFQPLAAGGFHRCDLCQFSGGPGVLRNGDVLVQMGTSNLFVPDSGVVYVTPSLVAHYIDAHHYQPPDEFIQAVLRCPDTRSMEYKRLLLANGGKGLFSRPSP